MGPLIGILMNVTVNSSQLSLAAGFTTTPTTTTSSHDGSANSLTVWVAVAIAIGYPILMVAIVFACKTYMHRYGPYAGMSYEEVYLNLTPSQRLYLIGVWCNQKCRRCCHINVIDETQPSAAFNVSDATQTLPSDLSAPPPPYDVALTMPRATTGSTVKFQIADGHVFEFKMSSDNSLSSSTISMEPPRFVDANSAGSQTTAADRPDSNVQLLLHLSSTSTATLPTIPSSLSRTHPTPISPTNRNVSSDQSVVDGSQTIQNPGAVTAAVIQVSSCIESDQILTHEF